MKIHPHTHSIIECDRIKPKDLPLSYISTDNTEMDLKIEKEDIISQSNTIKAVMPYDEFNVPAPILFDKNNVRVNTAEYMQRVKDKYIFMPKNVVEFIPDMFSFSIIAKKKMEYKSDKQYNIKIGCADTNYDYCKSLIKIFGDASRRGLCPNNISVNNKDIAIESLYNSSFKENDFVFIESSNGINYGTTSNPIDFDAILNECTNVWLCVDSFDNMLDAAGEYIINSNILYNQNNYTIDGYNKKFDIFTEHPSFPKSKYLYSTIFKDNTPILIIHQDGKGFIIVSEKSLVLNAEKNYKLIYETIMNIFLRSYYKSDNKSIWITNEPVQYVGNIYNKYDLRHESITIDSLLKNNDYEINNSLIVSVNIDSQNIIFSGIKDNNVLLFKKLDNKDPAKEDNQISIYTKRNTVMYYIPELYSIEESMNIAYTESDTGIYLLIAPYKSTALSIYLENNLTLRLTNYNYPNILCCKNNILSLIVEPLYDEIKHGVKLANVEVIKNIEVKNYDMRILGGGLPEKEYDDDYNLLDIGSLNGRPYRIGSGLIITLPKRLAEYKDIIEEEVNKHCSSGDYPILIFE